MRDHIHKMLSLTYICFAARVVTDRVSGYSKGFGFVRYATVEEASEGIKGMDGKVSWSWLSCSKLCLNQNGALLHDSAGNGSDLH